MSPETVRVPLIVTCPVISTFGAVTFTACEALISTALSVSILQPSGAWITIVLSCFIYIHTSGVFVWIAPTMTESDCEKER